MANGASTVSRRPGKRGSWSPSRSRTKFHSPMTLLKQFGVHVEQGIGKGNSQIGPAQTTTLAKRPQLSKRVVLKILVFSCQERPQRVIVPWNREPTSWASDFFGFPLSHPQVGHSGPGWQIPVQDWPKAVTWARISVLFPHFQKKSNELFAYQQHSPHPKSDERPGTRTLRLRGNNVGLIEINPSLLTGVPLQKWSDPHISSREKHPPL